MYKENGWKCLLHTFADPEVEENNSKNSLNIVCRWDKNWSLLSCFIWNKEKIEKVPYLQKKELCGLNFINIRWWRSCKFSNKVLSRHRFKTAYSSSWWWCNILKPKYHIVGMLHFFCLIPKWTAINPLCVADIRVIEPFYFLCS